MKLRRKMAVTAVVAALVVGLVICAVWFTTVPFGIWNAKNDLTTRLRSDLAVVLPASATVDQAARYYRRDPVRFYAISIQSLR